MDNPILNIEDSRNRLEAWKEEAERRAAETQAAGQRLQDLRVTASDDNNVAEVVIDSSGGLLDVLLSPRVLRQAPEHTQRAILEAYRRAKSKLAEAAAEIVSDTVGADSFTGKALLSGFADRDEDERR